MRIPSGKTDQVIYFVAVDATDLKTRETGLSAFTVYRSRNGGAATAYTTPTIAELSAANMPGVYSLLIDEDTAIAAGSDSEEYVVHITQAAMAPVTRTVELYRRDTTSGQTITVANGAADADVERLQGSVIAAPTVAGVLEVDVTHWIGTAVATPTVAGVPEVDITHFGGTAGTFAAGRAQVNTSHVAGTLQTAGDIIADTNDIQARLPAALTAGGNIKADALAWAGAATATDDVALATAPANFAALSITAGGLVDVTQGAADKVWSSATRTLTAFSAALAVSVWDVLETAIATASSIGLKVKTNLDAAVSSRLASASYTAPPSAAANAAAVWDEARAGHVAAGTFGQGVASVQGNVTGSVGSVVGDTPQTGDSFTRLGAPAGASIAADIAAIPTAAANADTLLDRANGVESGLTLRQCLRLASATLFGKLSGAATTTVAIRDFGDTKNRISATVDADGNRVAVVTDAS